MEVIIDLEMGGGGDGVTWRSGGRQRWWNCGGERRWCAEPWRWEAAVRGDWRWWPKLMSDVWRSEREREG